MTSSIVIAIAIFLVFLLSVVSAWLVNALVMSLKAVATLAARMESLRAEFNDMRPQGYHVTYMVIKDHDSNNIRANVPEVERIRYGREMLIQSQCVTFEKDSDARFVPEDMKIFIARSRPDADEITSIEILGVHGLTRAEIQANQEVLNALQGTAS